MHDRDETFDVVVVGFGFAGGSTAIAAADEGARVLLLEKMASPGGISVCSAGGVRTTSDPEAAFAYLRATNGGTSPDENLRALADGMAEVGRWLRQLAQINGANLVETPAEGNYPFEGFRDFGFVALADIPGFEPRAAYPHVRGLRGGARLFKVVQDNVAARPIEVRLGARALELIRDDRGVRGIVVELDGGRRAVRAKGGVVLACGGFEADEAMKAQYWQEKPVPTTAFLGNTGDGIRMAQAVGADLWHMWHYHGTYGFRHPDPAYAFGIRVTRFPDWTPGLAEGEGAAAFFTATSDMRMPWIVVDQAGRRYMNEYPPYPADTGHRPMTVYDPVTQRYPRIPSYIVLDQRGFEGHVLGFPTYNDPTADFGWSEDNSREVDLGILRRAGSLEDLATVIGCDAAALAGTVERWNELCRVGKDADFGREGRSMVPIGEPPFYAAAVWPIVANTQGGPVHDVAQRVLDPFRRPIEGLYAAGELGSLFGHLYLSGGNLAECFVGGRIAGREAARRSRAT